MCIARSLSPFHAHSPVGLPDAVAEVDGGGRLLAHEDRVVALQAAVLRRRRDGHRHAHEQRHELQMKWTSYALGPQISVTTKAWRTKHPAGSPGRTSGPKALAANSHPSALSKPSGKRPKARLSTKPLALEPEVWDVRSVFGDAENVLSVPERALDAYSFRGSSQKRV